MRLVVAVLLLVVGAATGLAGLALHARSWGLVLTLVALVVTLVALPPGWWSRLAFVAGWVVAIGVGLTPRPEGDFVVAGDGPGYALLLATLVVVVAAIVTLPRPRRRSPAAVPGAPAEAGSLPDAS